MANRYFEQFFLGLEKKRVQLYAQVTFGSTGAPTLVAANSRGVKSITRTSAGLYVITLQDSYQRTLGMTHVFLNATAPASPQMYIITDAVATVATPAITVTFANAGTATDPGSGEKVLLTFTLKNSSV